jgi:hypothetical protein
LKGASKFENGERGGLNLLQMIHITPWWWWHGGIQQFAKMAKWEIVDYVKKLKLWMSIANDQERFWDGDLHKKCSPLCGLG